MKSVNISDNDRKESFITKQYEGVGFSSTRYWIAALFLAKAVKSNLLTWIKRIA
jgi:hypothetical protein